MSRLTYLLRCLAHCNDPARFHCPSCGCRESSLVARKYLVTSLRRCRDCQLQFRAPTTSAQENAAYYQHEYTEGTTTTMPPAADIAEQKRSRFGAFGVAYAQRLKTLAYLGAQRGQSLLDYGCSWGYGSWLLQEAGFLVTGFEISRPRCRYAREVVGVNAVDSHQSLPGGNFDIFFSCHVLEHVPSVAATISFARTMLRPGGLFVAFTPNGSDEYRKINPSSWMKLWGDVHPNFLDERFYKRAVPDAVVASTPYEGRQSLAGTELMAAWRI